jgi:hypothetical protein
MLAVVAEQEEQLLDLLVLAVVVLEQALLVQVQQEQ